MDVDGVKLGNMIVSSSIFDAPGKMVEPAPIMGIENHLTWIKDASIIQGIMKCSKGSHEDMKTYVQSLLDDSPMELLEEHFAADPLLEAEGCDDVQQLTRRPTTFGVLAHKLNLAAMNAYVEYFGEAKKCLNHAILLLTEEFSNTISSGQSLAISYTIDSLEWCIEDAEKMKHDSLVEELEKLTIGNTSKITNTIETTNSKASKCKDILEALKKDPQAHAVLEFFKGNLAAALKVSLFDVLTMFQSASNLDPKCYLWHHYCYRMFRRIRRNVQRQKEGRLQNPCKKERAACDKAYQLATNNLECIIDMALLIKESLWIMNDSVWARHENEYLHCVELLREAIQIATETGTKSLICKTKMYLGELLVFGKGHLLNQLEGKLLFEECELENPNSSMVFHKLAKMYNYGAFKTEKFKDSELAKKYYIKALEAGRENYACLMEYIKFLKTYAKQEKFPLRRNRFFKIILETIESSLKIIKIDHQVATLQIERGLIIWLYNPLKSEECRTDACKVWVGVMKEFPEFAEKLCWSIKKPPFFMTKEKRAFIKIVDLVTELKKLKSVAEIDKDRETLTAIMNFIPKLPQHTQQ